METLPQKISPAIYNLNLIGGSGRKTKKQKKEGEDLLRSEVRTLLIFFPFFNFYS